MAVAIRSRREVRPDQAHWERRLWRGVFFGQQGDQRESGDQEDQQRVRELNRRAEDAEGAQAPQAHPPRECDRAQGRHDARPQGELQGCLSGLRAHGH